MMLGIFILFLGFVLFLFFFCCWLYFWVWFDLDFGFVFRLVWVFWVNFGLSEFDHLIIRSFTQIPGEGTKDRRTKNERDRDRALEHIQKRNFFYESVFSILAQ